MVCAWIRDDGTLDPDFANVGIANSGITKTDTGKYSLTFATSGFATKKPVVVACVHDAGANDGSTLRIDTEYTNTNLTVWTFDEANNLADIGFNIIAIGY